MKKLMVFCFLGLSGCAGPSVQQRWHDRLFKVDSAWMWNSAQTRTGWFSPKEHGVGSDTAASVDSAIWAISEDSQMVKEIERAAAEPVTFDSERRVEDSLYNATPLNTTASSTGRDTLVHSALMDYYDSIDAAGNLRGDSIALNLDSLTLLARSGNSEAQRELDIRHKMEGDINGAWTSRALMIRDDSMRAEITELKARIALSDSAKARLEKLK